MYIYYDKQTDYQALINRAVARGDLFAAARYERQRNKKIDDLNANDENIYNATKTDLYSKYLKRPHAGRGTAQAASGKDTDEKETSRKETSKQETSKQEAVAADPFGSLTRKVAALVEKRKPFSWKADADPLVETYRDTYAREGKRAMQDTLQELSSSAGGLNSYAVTAARQQGDYHAAKMADKIPELYQLAYTVYAQESDRLIDLLKAVK